MSASTDLRRMPRARLIVRGEISRVIELDVLPFTIGRHADASLQLRDACISREHAVLDWDGDGYFIEDAGSRHGTLVNGRPAKERVCRLHDHDEIELGGGCVTLVFEQTPDETPALSLLSKQAGASSSSNELETLTLFLRAAQSLDGYGALDDVLATMLEYTLRLTNAERGFVFLGLESDALKLGRGQDRHGAVLTDFTGVSRTVMREAALSDRDFVFDDVAAGGPTTGQDTLQLHSIRSVAAIPLRGGMTGQMLGLLYLDSHAARHNFSHTDKAILHAIARQAAMLLESFRMLEREREATLLRKEIEIAATIQRQILPQVLPELGDVRVTAQSVPCAGVGGDFYDVIPVEDGFVAVVADVCGKGVPAALLAAVAHGMMHAQVRSGVGLVEAVDGINRFICARSPAEKYLTMVALQYRRSASGAARVEVLNGGHVAPIIVRRDGRVEVHAEGDVPVGLLASACFHASVLELHPGDRLVVLSDGITEAENRKGEQFSEHELDRVLGGKNPVAALFAALERFTGGQPALDDQTVMVLERV